MRTDDLIGVPFKYGGRGPDFYDCLGLFREMFKRYDGTIIEDHESTDDHACNGVRLEAAANSKWWIRVEEPSEGCAVLMRAGSIRFANHVGFMLDSTRFIHTMEQANGVTIERITHPAWEKRIIGFYRRGNASA